MRTVVRRRGNGASIRIPPRVLKAAGIEIGDAVDVREERGRIVVDLHPACGDIADLVAKITPDNLHDPVDFGPSIGREQL